MSSPSGGNDVVFGTSASQPTVEAKLDAPTSSGFCSIELSTRSNTNAPIWSVKTLLAGALADSMKTPAVVAKPVSPSSARAFLIDVLDWSAQLIGSLSIFDPDSRTKP